ncbi:helix-turn-helix domain-containing protein [Streptomyces sp. NPDC085524]|uniref:helix-turn-helix domain-containing protein n=1 Tax=Streptomyces sp. NPDC085524 TaxID=3365728 RepID=UPI0037CDA452
MGREPSALAEHTARGLAQWLLSLRQASGLSISQVASRTERMGMSISRSTLYRAELVRMVGKQPSIPSWPVVEAYTKACGGNITEARRLWTKAASVPAPSKTASTAPRRPAKALQYISEPVDLLHAMQNLRLRAGNPSLRELENRAKPRFSTVTLLPRSTLGAVLNGTRPCRREFLGHFVRACGVTNEAEVMRWLQAWDRIEASRTGTVNHDMHHRLTALEEDLHHTKAALATVLTLPKPRHEPEPVLVPDTRPSDAEHPQVAELVTEPAPVTRVRTKPSRTRRSGQWLSGLVKGISAAF